MMLLPACMKRGRPAEDLNKSGAFSIARLHVIAFGAVSLALPVYAGHLLITS
jgi:hypothetical protein